MDVCTIIAKNYLPAARVLATSLERHHPEARMHVLVIDEIGGRIDPAAEPFEVLDPHAIGLADFDRMAGIYTVLELSTAVKPALLKHLLERGDGDGVVYLDPDMRLYAPIPEVFDAIREHGLVLNPHNTRPMPRDGRKPNEQDILIAGAYNLGFIGLAPGDFSGFLLDWWGERLETDCIVDPEHGFFVDQRWIDLVPGLAKDFHLIRDPGFNVAYWNLGSRDLGAMNGGYVVDGAPLRLFHFSGFSPDSPHRLSRHQDRIRLSDHPALARLCSDYARELVERGFEEAGKWPYSWDRTPSGISLDRTLRLAYRDAVLAGEVSGSLFTTDGEREFLEWCNTPAQTGGEHGVTRYIEVLHESRKDLQVIYGDLSREGQAEGLVGWVHAHGASELGVPEVLLHPETAPGAEDPGTRAPERPLAVNVAGYLRSELGVGEVGRQVVAALDANSVPVLPVGLHAPNSRAGHGYAAPSRVLAPFDINLVCVNADGLPAFAKEAGPGFFEGRHTIGVWWWELASFPLQYHGAFDLVDEIWAGSSFVASALSDAAPVPVLTMPLPLTPPHAAEPARERFGLDPDAFVFLFSFDYNSVFERKNPIAAIEAFTRAFGDDPGVTLVVKTINEGKDPDNRDRLRLAVAGKPNVELIEGYLDVGEKDRLTASSDAYVSLHRSEGFGLGLAEALMLGKPVVATDYGGSTDFIDEDTGFPVRYELTEVGPDAWPYDPASEWAEPDVDHAAEQLARVRAEPETARARAVRGGRLLRTAHSPEAAGARMAQRLATIHARRRNLPAPPAALSGTLPEPPVQELAARIRRGPVAAERSPLGPVGKLARKAVLRLMRPYTAHSAAVEHDLAKAAELQDENLRRAVAAVQLDEAVLHAVQLAEARRTRAALAGIEAPSTAPAGAPDDRVDELRAQVDELRFALGVQQADLTAAGLRLHAPVGTPEESQPAYPEAPSGEPWSEAYTKRHREFVARALDDAALLARLRSGEPLPQRHGVGFDERVVELPWVAAQQLAGGVLDAGSALNHLHVLSRLRARVDDLHIVTLAPEEESFPQLGVSYLYADLREIPIVDGRYDRVVCVSTLEHVGLDNAYYGGATDVVADPQAEAVKAVRELARVLKPGGDLYLTVPVGRAERFDWVRSLSHEQLDELVAAFEPAEVAIGYYRYDAGGWRLSDRESTADDRYRDHFSSGPVGPDRRVAAQAVACVHAVKRR